MDSSGKTHSTRFFGKGERLLSLLLCLCMVLSLLPAVALATSITAPLNFSSETADTSGSGYTWTYVNSYNVTEAISQTNCTGVLALNGMSLSTAAGEPLIVPDGTLITFAGTNTIAYTGTSSMKEAIECSGGSGDLKIEGAAGAKLTVTAYDRGINAAKLALGGRGDLSVTASNSSSYAIKAAEDMTVTGGTVNATGGKQGINLGGYYSSIDNYLKISGGTVNARATGTGASTQGVYCNLYTIQVTGGKLFASSAGNGGTAGNANLSAAICTKKVPTADVATGNVACVEEAEIGAASATYTGTDGTFGTYYVGGSVAKTLVMTVNAPGVTVIFNDGGADGGNLPDASLYTGSSFTMPGAGNLYKTDYTFGGWQDSVSNAVYGQGVTYTVITTPITFTAQWTLNQSTVSYADVDGFTEPAPAGGSPTTAVAITTAVPAKAGFTFLCWNTAANGMGSSYPAGVNIYPAEDITLYPQWIKDSLTGVSPVQNLADGDIVYFGSYGTFAASAWRGTPIAWKVLDADRSNASTAGSAFLVTENVMSSYGDRDGGGTAFNSQNTWFSTFLSNAFTDAERNALTSVSKTDNNGGMTAADAWDHQSSQVYDYSSNLSNAKVFSLSVAEVVYQTYFANAAARTAYSADGQTLGAFYLTRSTCIDNGEECCGLVSTNDTNVNTIQPGWVLWDNTAWPVRPAANLGFATLGWLTSTGAADAYKLTFRSGDTFSASADPLIGTAGGSVQVSHQALTATYDSVYAEIREGGDILAVQTLNGSLGDSSSTLSLAGLEAGDYSVLLYGLDAGAGNAPSVLTAPSAALALTVNAAGDPTYVVSGDISGATANPTAVLVRKGQTYNATVTGASAPYHYTATVPAGIYNLVVTVPAQGETEEVTITTLVTVVDAAVTKNVTIPSGEHNSKVTVAAATSQGAQTPNVEAGGLDIIAKTIGEQPGNTDKRVLIELKIQENEESTHADEVKTSIAGDGKLKGIVMDVDLLKQIDEAAAENISEVKPEEVGVGLITVVFHLPESLCGKMGYAIYRYHGSTVDKITETQNANGEYLIVSGDATTITAHLKFFSTYAIGYNETPTTVGNTIYANATALYIDDTGVYIDADRDGILDAGELTYLPSADLSAYSIYGGYENKSFEGNTLITQVAGSVAALNGGSASGTVTGNTVITLKGGTSGTVFGGANVTGTKTVNLSGNPTVTTGIDLSTLTDNKVTINYYLTEFSGKIALINPSATAANTVVASATAQDYLTSSNSVSKASAAFKIIDYNLDTTSGAGSAYNVVITNANAGLVIYTVAQDNANLDPSLSEKKHFSAAETVTVDIYAKSTPSFNANRFQFTLDYPTSLTLTGISAAYTGTVVKNGNSFVFSFTSASGNIPVNNTGVKIATATFTVGAAHTDGTNIEVSVLEHGVGHPLDMGEQGAGNISATVGDKAAITLNNLTVTLHSTANAAFGGMSDKTSVAYARYGRTGLYTDNTYGTVYSFPSITAGANYRLKDADNTHLWGDAAVSPTTTYADNAAVSGKLYTQSEEIYVLTTGTVKISFVAGTNGSLSSYSDLTVDSGSTLEAVSTADGFPTITPDAGYRFAGWKVNGEGDYLDATHAFADDTSLTPIFVDATYTNGGAAFEKNTTSPDSGGTPTNEQYPVDVVDPSVGGSSSASVKQSPSGAVVTVVDTPDSGYGLGKLTITDANGNPVPYTLNSNGVYTFIMPECGVTITTAYVKKPWAPDTTGVSSLLQTKHHIKYINGYSNGTVGPNRNVTRAEAAQMFYNLLIDQNIASTVTFADVPDTKWCAKAVNALATLHVITGYGNGNFGPEDMITREQFCAMAVRFTNLTDVDATAAYSDIDPSMWSYDSVMTAASIGWINGYSDGRFGPKDNITRAQVVTIINHMLGRSADRSFVGMHRDALVSFSDLADDSVWYYYDMVEATNEHIYVMDANYSETWEQIQSN